MATQSTAAADDDRKLRIEQLLTTRKSITSFFRRRSEELQSIKECRVIPTNYILDFSRYTTFTLRAPDGWTPGMPLIGGHPPAPQPDQMRDGVLQRYNQQRPIIIAPPQVIVMKEMKDIVKLEPLPKTAISSGNISIKIKRPSAPEEASTTPLKVVKEELKTSIQKITAPLVTKDINTVADQQPHKRARQINISFGLSDSESSSDEGEK